MLLLIHAICNKNTEKQLALLLIFRFVFIIHSVRT